MQLTTVLTILAVAVTASARRPPPPPPRPAPPPPSPVFQQVQCSSGAPYCCSPAEQIGTTCSKLSGSSVSCNSLIVCCNNNQGTQACSANLENPITFIGF